MRSDFEHEIVAWVRRCRSPQIVNRLTIRRRADVVKNVVDRCAKLTWDVVQNIRARAKASMPQRELVTMFNIPQSLCSEIVRGEIWNPDSKLTTGDEMRDRIIGALDTAAVEAR